MDEQMMPAEGAAPAGGAEGKDQFTDLVSNITDGMAMLTDVMGQVNPDAAAELGAIADQYKSAIEKAMASAGGGAAPAGAGMASAQVGGAKAVPASPAGIPRG
jgi:hypothetical protein